MFSIDINRVIVLILIGALLLALYYHQFQSIPFISSDRKAIEHDEGLSKRDENVTPDKKTSKQPKRDKNAKQIKRSKDDKTDLISIDNMSQVSLGSLVDLDVESKDGRPYKKASELNSLESAGTFGSLMDGETENENFFFR
jgi:hypothetical protein